MKSFIEFLEECELSKLQQLLKDAGTPEEVERITKLKQTLE